MFLPPLFGGDSNCSFGMDTVAVSVWTTSLFKSWKKWIYCKKKYQQFHVSIQHWLILVEMLVVPV